jgi:hypothetical protein
VATVKSPSWDHNHECVGCGAHFSEPCHPACPFETGEITASVVLRAAVINLAAHRAGIGYSIDSALWAAAMGVVDDLHQVRQVTNAAHEALADFLVSEGADASIRGQLVLRQGLFTPVDEIARHMYAAAAQADGIEFDADAFGEYPA